jgi:hypothetical protein
MRDVFHRFVDGVTDNADERAVAESDTISSCVDEDSSVGNDTPVAGSSIGANERAVADDDAVRSSVEESSAADSNIPIIGSRSAHQNRPSGFVGFGGGGAESPPPDSGDESSDADVVRRGPIPHGRHSTRVRRQTKFFDGMVSTVDYVKP